MFFLQYFCRNRILFCILNVCKEAFGRLPEVVGIDVVEMALWAKVSHIFILSEFFTIELVLNHFYANSRVIGKTL